MSAAPSAAHPAAPPLPQSPDAFIQQWLPMVLATIMVPPGSSDAQMRDNAFSILNDVLRPRDPAEAMFAGMCVAVLHVGLESLRQAAAPGLPEHLACRLRGNGFAGFRMALTLVGKLEQGRGGAPTKFLPPVPAMTAMLQAEAVRQNRIPTGRSVAEAAAAELLKEPPPWVADPPVADPPEPPVATPQQINPMPSENAAAPRPEAETAAPAPRPDPAAPPPRAPAARLVLPPIPQGLSRKDRKAAKYALRRAMREAAKPASPGAPSALAAPKPRA